MIFGDKEKINKWLILWADWLVLAIIFLIPLCFALFYEVNSVFILYKTVLLRVSVSLLFLIVLARFFWIGNWQYRFKGIIFWLMAFLAAAWSLASFFSLDRAASLGGSYERQQGLLTLIFYLLFFLLLIFQLADFSQVKRCISAMLLSSFFVCFYGFAQVFNFDPVRWQESFWSNGRIFSTLGQPDFLGHYLVLVIPFTVFALIFFTRRNLVRILLLVLLFSQIFCLFFSYGRAAWLGMAAEIFLAVIGLLLIKGWKKIAIGLVVLTIVVSSLLFVFLTNSPVGKVDSISLSSRFLTSFDLRHGSVKARLNVWQGALAEIREENWQRRLFGFGPDELSSVFVRQYQSDWSLDESINTWPDRAHDSFLDIILTFGFVGLAAYVLFFGYFFFQLLFFLRRPRSDQPYWLGFFCLLALAGYFVNNLLSFSDTPQFLYLYLILGLVVFLVSQAEPARQIKLGLSKYSRALIYLFAVILVVIFLFYDNWRTVQADYYFMAAVKSSGDCQTMLADDRKALLAGGEYNLFYAEQYVSIGMNCYGQLPDAKARQQVQDSLLWCLSLLPRGTDYSDDRTRADAEANLAENADKSYSSLAEKDFVYLTANYPNIYSGYEDWAAFSNALGNYAESIKIIGRGTSTLPLAQMINNDYVPHRDEINVQLIGFYDLLASAYAGEKENDQALYYYQKILEIDPDQLAVYKKIADIYYLRGDWAEALWYNKRGYSLSPNDPAWPTAIGLLLREKGDLAGAKKYFAQAAILGPDSTKLNSPLMTAPGPKPRPVFVKKQSNHLSQWQKNIMSIWTQIMQIFISTSKH
jgi:O-antigen ligase